MTAKPKTRNAPAKRGAPSPDAELRSGRGRAWAHEKSLGDLKGPQEMHKIKEAEEILAETKSHLETVCRAVVRGDYAAAEIAFVKFREAGARHQAALLDEHRTGGGDSRP
jgi:hypothetical protein